MDAVPGRIAPEATGSSHDRTYCQPCAEDGKRIFPEAFCPVCKEFLCSNCARVHRNMKLTKSHALQDKNSMPSSFHADSEDEAFTETCQFHTKEFIKYYCTNHKALLCGECLADKTHRSCNIERISQLAKRYKKGAEYNSLKAGLAQMVSDIGKLSHNIHTGMKLVDDENITNINEIRKFRNEINQYLDKREKELLEEIEQKKQKSQSLLSELKSNCQDIKAASEKLKAELQAREVKNNQLFISGTRAIKELVGLQTALKDIRGKNRVPDFKFSRDPATEQLLASCTAIGRVDQAASDLADQQKQPQGPAFNQSRADLSQSQFSKLPDIPVKASTNTRDCHLTSVALLPGDRLLLADYINCSVKLVDTQTNKVVSEVKLPGQPWDLCLLPGDRAAVTLPNQGKIQFVSTQGNVTLQDVVKVDGQCYGIDFCDDSLIVSFFSPCKVVLMDMKGNVKKCVDKDSTGKPLFMYPQYLTVTRESPTPIIVISDSYTDTITKLSISLEVIQSFQDPILRSPCGLAAVGDNQLLMCGRDSHNILLLDTLTGKITQLLGKEEGIERPHSVAYCSQKKMMFVTCYPFPGNRPGLQNFVKVFNLV